MQELLKLLGLKRGLIILATVIGVLGLGSGISYYKGYQSAKRICKAETQAATLEGIKTHGKIEKEVMRLNDPDLDSRLSKWMRD
jgi:hypothetical protein